MDRQWYHIFLGEPDAPRCHATPPQCSYGAPCEPEGCDACLQAAAGPSLTPAALRGRMCTLPWGALLQLRRPMGQRLAEALRSTLYTDTLVLCRAYSTVYGRPNLFRMAQGFLDFFETMMLQRSPQTKRRIQVWAGVWGSLGSVSAPSPWRSHIGGGEHPPKFAVMGND